MGPYEYWIEFSNGDIWRAVSARESARGNKVNVSYIDRKIESGEIGEPEKAPEYQAGEIVEEVPADVIEKEKEILRAQAIEEGKPEKIIEKMVEGRIKTFYDENCLVCQKFVKDPSKTIEQLVVEATATIGEKIAIRRFARFEMGEGLQKKSENLADAVAEQVSAMHK